jgi:hypothetical protein
MCPKGGAGRWAPASRWDVGDQTWKTGRTTLHRELLSFRPAAILFYVSRLGSSSLAGGACEVRISAIEVSCWLLLLCSAAHHAPCPRLAAARRVSNGLVHNQYDLHVRLLVICGAWLCEEPLLLGAARRLPTHFPRWPPCAGSSRARVYNRMPAHVSLEQVFSSLVLSMLRAVARAYKCCYSV